MDCACNLTGFVYRDGKELICVQHMQQAYTAAEARKDVNLAAAILWKLKRG